jgi:uncharacterized protein YyaL (SSP411 family)
LLPWTYLSSTNRVVSTKDVLGIADHFEKMLYDNALLSRVYLHAYQASADPFSRRIVEETLGYVLHEMVSPDGGFYSTQDADNEGEDCKFFVWTPNEVDTPLGQADGPLFRTCFDVIQAGNASTGSAHGFEHKNILHIDHSLEEVAARLSVTTERLSEAIERGKRILFEAREKRIKPGRDEEVLTAWNGLMLASMAEAGAVLGRNRHGHRAVHSAHGHSNRCQLPALAAGYPPKVYQISPLVGHATLA